jgi:hypothetical protein
MKKYKQNFRKKFNLDIYTCELHVLLNYDVDKFLKEYCLNSGKECDPDEYRELFNSPGCYSGFHRLIKGPKDQRPIIIVKITTDGIDLSDIAGVISHESFHAAYLVMDTINNKLSVDGEEAWAYLCGYIAKCTMQTVLSK